MWLVQEKVFEEILNVFNDDFVTVTMEHCNELTYMEQCIKETLRRFTVIPVTIRQSSEPIKLNGKTMYIKLNSLYLSLPHFFIAMQVENFSGKGPYEEFFF